MSQRISVTKIMTTETGHRLTQYAGKCAHFHGHSYRWEVTASAKQLDRRGMVLDFKDLKVAMKKVLEPLDHAFVMHDQDPFIKLYGAYKAREMLDATNGEEARLFLVSFNPTAENMAWWVAASISEVLPPDVRLEKIKVWETANSFCIWEAPHETE